jgi:hypothetical protein
MDMEVQADHFKQFGFEVATGTSSGVRSEIGRITKINCYGKFNVETTGLTVGQVINTLMKT